MADERVSISALEAAAKKYVSLKAGGVYYFGSDWLDEAPPDAVAAPMAAVAVTPAGEVLAAPLPVAVPMLAVVLTPDGVAVAARRYDVQPQPVTGRFQHLIRISRNRLDFSV